ncbi:GNAT family N-acetyltransferase [Deinococcus roseus]|uniref:GNAT family acetyltransferase n=1 Tax=Deinococcus roseus TaxID=392414 RepID=A0ABQ2D8J4_9DEIO|nr:GNAT family N-acetyltransferase [Deinococcus roseus]GGJ48725.1 GNAT family acetyltransferase [Deinococcus roseus]
MRYLQERALTPEQLAQALNLQVSINETSGLDLKLGLDYEPLKVHETPWNRHHLMLNGDRVVGYGSILGAYHMPELKVMVAPEFRRQGMATRMLRSMARACAVPGVQKVLGICEAASSAGQAFLQKWGVTLDFAEYRMVLNLGQFEAPELPEGTTESQAAPEDAESIAEGARKDFGFGMNLDDLRRELREEPEPHRVLKVNGRVVSNLRVFHTESRAGIYAFRVHPDFRRKGLGELLMRQVLFDLQQQGYQQVWLEVNSSNPPAIALYKKLGFEVSVNYGYYRL